MRLKSWFHIMVLKNNFHRHTLILNLHVPNSPEDNVVYSKSQVWCDGRNEDRAIHYFTKHDGQMVSTLALYLLVIVFKNFAQRPAMLTEVFFWFSLVIPGTWLEIVFQNQGMMSHSHKQFVPIGLIWNIQIIDLPSVITLSDWRQLCLGNWL